MKYPSWVMWLALFVILVMIFPKECERNPPSQTIEYRCLGINKVFTSKIQSTNQDAYWCSGVCVSKSLNTINKNNSNSTINDSEGPIGTIMGSFSKILPVLAIIVAIILIINWVSSIKRKGGGGEIRVITGPGQ